jgi:glutamate/tyrosine decarboxylase-like PLP-dependent enzyme
VERANAVADHLAAAVDRAPDLERLAPVTLSVVCFRYRGPTPGAAVDALNRTIVERVQEGGEAFITGTEIRGRFALRACVLHYATTEADVDALPDIVRRAARA